MDDEDDEDEDELDDEDDEDEEDEEDDFEEVEEEEEEEEEYSTPSLLKPSDSSAKSISINNTNNEIVGMVTLRKLNKLNNPTVNRISSNGSLTGKNAKLKEVDTNASSQNDNGPNKTAGLLNVKPLMAINNAEQSELTNSGAYVFRRAPGTSHCQHTAKIGT